MRHDNRSEFRKALKGHLVHPLVSPSAQISMVTFYFPSKVTLTASPHSVPSYIPDLHYLERLSFS